MSDDDGATDDRDADEAVGRRTARARGAPARADQVTAGLFLLAALAGIGLLVVYVTGGQPQWEGGLLASSAVASEWREVTSGRFEAEPHWTLESGKRHYYLITVESNDATLRPRQATGSFVPAFGR